MPIWTVRATWLEDEAQVSETWEVNAQTAHEAIEDMTSHIAFSPHHVEASLNAPSAGGPSDEGGLPPGQMRRLEKS